MRQLIFHSIRMRKVQSASILISIALSAALFLVLGGIYGGVTQGISLSAERSGADLLVVPGDARSYLDEGELLYTGVPVPMYMDEDVMDAIRGLEGVERATAQFFSQTLNASCCSATDETRLVGINLDDDFIVSPLLPDGFGGQLADDEVIVGSQVDGIVDGVLHIYGKPYRVAATMAESGGDLDHSIIMDMDVARQVSAQTDGFDSTWEKYGASEGLISAIMVDATDDAEVYEKLKIKLNLTDGVAYVENAETAERTQDQMRSVFLLLAGAAVLMLAVTVLQLFARFYSCVWDRKSELALYRAIGASQREIRGLIGGEVALLAGGGAIVGIVVGFILYRALLGVLADSLAFPFVSVGAAGMTLLIAGIIVLIAVLSFLSIIWPLRQVGRLDPSLAMQQGDID